MEHDTAGQSNVMRAEPEPQHAWLRKFVGDWVYESAVPAEPGKPAETISGHETVRSVGDLWIVAEGHGEDPGGGEARTVTTLGYDPRERRFVGTWIGSMMHHLWVYDGKLDAAGKVLTLDTTGPDFRDPATTRPFQDIIEIQDDDHRQLIARMRGDDGEWQEIMRMSYRRT